MKKIILASVFFVACNNGGSSETAKDTAATTVPVTDTLKPLMASVKYTCKMHPEVISDTAGKCPKCGMQMIPMTDSMMKMHKNSMMKMDSMPIKY